MNLQKLKEKIKSENLKTFYKRKLKKPDHFFGLRDVTQEEALKVKQAYEEVCAQVDACSSEEEVIAIIGKLSHSKK